MGGPHCDADVRTQFGVGISHHDHHITVGPVHILCQRVDQTQVLLTQIGLFDVYFANLDYIFNHGRFKKCIQKQSQAGEENTS